jgi:hypothetical protein
MTQNVETMLAEIDTMLDKIGESEQIDPIVASWAASHLQKQLTALRGAATRRKLPRSNVNEYALSLSTYIGMLLGVRKTDGHPRQTHLAWAIADMKRMRSPHAFGPILKGAV